MKKEKEKAEIEKLEAERRKRKEEREQRKKQKTQDANRKHKVNPHLSWHSNHSCSLVQRSFYTMTVKMTTSVVCVEKIWKRMMISMSCGRVGSSGQRCGHWSCAECLLEKFNYSNDYFCNNGVKSLLQESEEYSAKTFQGTPSLSMQRYMHRMNKTILICY